MDKEMEIMSDMVREVIQKDPPVFVVYGTIVVTIIVAILFIVVFLVYNEFF